MDSKFNFLTSTTFSMKSFCAFVQETYLNMLDVM